MFNADLKSLSAYLREMIFIQWIGVTQSTTQLICCLHLPIKIRGDGI